MDFDKIKQNILNSSETSTSESESISGSELHEEFEINNFLPEFEPIKLSGKNLAQNYVSAFNAGMNIYQCVNYLQGNIDWTIKAVNDVVKSWNTEVSESIDQSKAIVRETTTEQFNVEWTNKQPELIEQVNTLTTNQFNEDWGVLENRINTTLETQNTNIENIQNEQNVQNTKINSIQTQQTNLDNKQTTLSNRMDTFTSLSSGSTTGDAELQDIRVGANGVTYPNAGNAVRGQYSELKEYIVNADSLLGIIPLTNKLSSKTYNGIKWDLLNNDIIATGEATGLSWCHLYNDINVEVGKTYILSGCPVGGAENTYKLYVENVSDGLTIANDYGKSVEFIARKTPIRISALIASGYVIKNELSFKPILLEHSKLVNKVDNIEQSVIAISNNLNEGSIHRDQLNNDIFDTVENIIIHIKCTKADKVAKKQTVFDLVKINTNYSEINTLRITGEIIPISNNINSVGFSFRDGHAQEQFISVNGKTKFDISLNEIGVSGTNLPVIVRMSVGRDQETQYGDIWEYKLKNIIIYCNNDIFDLSDVDFSGQSGFLNEGTYEFEKNTTIYEGVAKKSDVGQIQLYKKSWAVFGDSISDGRQNASRKYWKVIAESNKMNIYDYAVSATGYMLNSNHPNETNIWGNENHILAQIKRMTEKPDYITVFAGTNNWGLDNGYVLGDITNIESNTDDLNLYTAVSDVCKYLINNFKNSKIMFITPIPRFKDLGGGPSANDCTIHTRNSRGFSLLDMAKCIKEVCEYYSIPCYCITKESGIYKSMVDEYMEDGLHPNNKLHEILAQKIESRLKML